ncbi:MAG: sigma-70 family RNA polymerase sigma factor [Phycisphaera sp.]|nr:sigma-70 family RNA polymerase sigma factor [Phycisphaera sp.]
MEHESTQSDDRGRFARLWVTAQPVVAAFLNASVRRRVEAEDLLQDVAAAAMVDFESYDPQRSFTGWALGIARFRVLNHFRTARRDRHVFGDAALERLAEACAGLESQTGPYREALGQCLDKLPERQRQMIELRYVESVARRDVAERFGVTPAALGMALHRIRGALAECIESSVAGGGA